MKKIIYPVFSGRFFMLVILEKNIFHRISCIFALN